MRKSSFFVAIGAVAVAVGVTALALWPREGGAPAALPPSPTVTPEPVGTPTVLEPSPTPAASALQFVAFGDWGNRPTMKREVFRQLERTNLQPGFTDIIAVGDNNYGTADTFDAFVQTELGPLLSRGVKLHMVLGNHDVESDEKRVNQTGNMAYGEWDCSACLRSAPPSANRRYYSFYKAPVRFIMLDSDLMLEGDEDQYRWAVEELTASNMANESWQVLVFHHPPFSAAQTHGGIKELVDRYKPLLPALGVDVVFNGHDHTYERIATTDACGAGVQYIVTGAMDVRAGDIKTPNGCTAAYWDKSQAFVHVAATPQKFSAQVLTADGQVVDTWEITR
ncbi:MAG: metallophosphoesterase [bacterium]|nr:metallophosphoesterase [bacterium]